MNFDLTEAMADPLKHIRTQSILSLSVTYPCALLSSTTVIRNLLDLLLSYSFRLVKVPPLLSSAPPPLKPLSVSPLLPLCPPISRDSSVCQQQCNQRAEEGKPHPEVSLRDESSPDSCCLEAAHQSHRRPSILKRQQQRIPNVTWPGALPF